MLLSGHNIKPIDGKEEETILKNFLAFRDGVSRLIPGNWFMPTAILKDLNKIYSFPFQPTDVIIVTYPKCGTTWMQEIVWTMMNNPNISNRKANIGINTKCHFLELDTHYHMANPEAKISDPVLLNIFSELCPNKDPSDGIYLSIAKNSQSPRTFKTHLPLSLMHPSLLEKCKVIYIARNPKDVCVSLLHSHRLLKCVEYVGTQEKLIDYFVNNELMYSPYGLHLKEAWQKRDHQNLHFTFFEDTKANPKKAIQELNTFLNTNLTETQISNVVNYTTFSAMKARDELVGNNDSDFIVQSVLQTDGGFFRRGEAGCWKEKLTDDQEEKIDKWTKEFALEIPFRYK